MEEGTLSEIILTNHVVSIAGQSRLLKFGTVKCRERPMSALCFMTIESAQFVRVSVWLSGLRVISGKHSVDKTRGPFFDGFSIKLPYQ